MKFVIVSDNRRDAGLVADLAAGQLSTGCGDRQAPWRGSRLAAAPVFESGGIPDPWVGVNSPASDEGDPSLWILPRPEDWRDLAETVRTIEEPSEVLLVFAHPVEFVGRAMSQGIAPRAAIEHWLDVANACLYCESANPQQTMLIDIDSVRSDPGAAAQALRSRLDLAPNSSGEIPRPAYVATVYDLIAWYAVSTEQRVGALWPQLCQRALCGNTALAPRLDATLMFQSYWDLMQEQRVGADLGFELLRSRDARATCERERRLLSMQLQDAYAELEARTYAAPPGDNEDGVVADVGLMVSSAGLYSGSLDQDQGQDQGPGQGYLADVRRLEAQNQELTERLRRVQRELEAVHASTSWRITKPLRALATHLGKK